MVEAFLLPLFLTLDFIDKELVRLDHICGAFRPTFVLIVYQSPGTKNSKTSTQFCGTPSVKPICVETRYIIRLHHNQYPNLHTSTVVNQPIVTFCVNLLIICLFIQLCKGEDTLILKY